MIFFENLLNTAWAYFLKVFSTKCFPTSHTSVHSFAQLILLLLLIFAFYSIKAGSASFSFARAYRWCSILIPNSSGIDSCVHFRKLFMPMTQVWRKQLHSHIPAKQKKLIAVRFWRLVVVQS